MCHCVWDVLSETLAQLCTHYANVCGSDGGVTPRTQRRRASSSDTPVVHVHIERDMAPTCTLLRSRHTHTLTAHALSQPIGFGTEQQRAHCGMHCSCSLLPDQHTMESPRGTLYSPSFSFSMRIHSSGFQSVSPPPPIPRVLCYTACVVSPPELQHDRDARVHCLMGDHWCDAMLSCRGVRINGCARARTARGGV